MHIPAVSHQSLNNKAGKATKIRSLCINNNVVLTEWIPTVYRGNIVGEYLIDLLYFKPTLFKVKFPRARLPSGSAIFDRLPVSL